MTRDDWHAIHHAADVILSRAEGDAFNEVLERAASTFGHRHAYQPMWEAMDAWATARGARRRVAEVQWGNLP